MDKYKKISEYLTNLDKEIRRLAEAMAKEEQNESTCDEHGLEFINFLLNLRENTMKKIKETSGLTDYDFITLSYIYLSLDSLNERNESHGTIVEGFLLAKDAFMA